MILLPPSAGRAEGQRPPSAGMCYDVRMKPQWNIIVPLAALGLVRTLMHVNKVYETVPRAEGAVWLAIVAAWIAVIVVKKIPNPFDTLLITGSLHGLLSALVQQAYWTTFWADVAATDVLAADVMNPGVRIIAIGSTVLMGFLWGAAAGLAAAAILRFRGKKKPTSLDFEE
jgi:hypothetical protein